MDERGNPDWYDTEMGLKYAEALRPGDIIVRTGAGFIDQYAIEEIILYTDERFVMVRGATQAHQYEWDALVTVRQRGA